ncbi:MAG: hypothetical protein AAGP08_04640 [Pseudomonadota bacterium]
MRDYRHTVVCGRIDRLGFRLRNMLCAWELAERIGARLIVNWNEHDKYENIPFNLFQILDSSIETTHGDFFTLDSRPYEALCADIGLDPKRKFDLGPDLTVADLQASAPGYLPYRSDSPYRFQGRARDDGRAAIRDVFWRLPLAPAVSDALLDLQSRFDIARATTVHVRRGDIVSKGKISIPRDTANPDAWRTKVKLKFGKFGDRYAPERAYHDAIEATAPGSPLVILSNDAELRTRLEGAFSDRVVPVHEALDAADLSVMQRAFVEMLVMAKSATIIGTQSQFAKLPSILGPVPFVPVFDYADPIELFDLIEDVHSDVPDRAELLDAFAEYYVEKFHYWDMPVAAARFETFQTERRAQQV